jgi:carbon monoxide dehydrogenase subunit G
VINIAVSVQRTFTLPANLAATTDYLCDLPRTLEDLPHLALVKTHGPDQYRIVYRAAGAGVYRVALYCDVAVHFDELSRAVRVVPLDGVATIPFRRTMNSLTGQGYYSSQAVLEPSGASTNVIYDVQITAQVPKRPALALVPDAVVERAIERVVKQRLLEIVDVFALSARP